MYYSKISLQYQISKFDQWQNYVEMAKSGEIIIKMRVRKSTTIVNNFTTVMVRTSNFGVQSWSELKVA